MKHHKKSNNGVFSKKQKQASRSLMYSRSGFQRRTGGTGFIPSEGGILKAMAAGLLALVGRQRRP